jgi:uncharacterized protein
MAGEMTMSEALTDPLIALINKTDGIDERSFAQLLESAARVRSFAEARPLISAYASGPIGAHLPKSNSWGCRDGDEKLFFWQKHQFLASKTSTCDCPPASHAAPDKAALPIPVGYGDEILGTVTLSCAERILLANQFKILEILDPNSANEYSQSREIVEAGYQYLYETINTSISTADMPAETGEEVSEILDMFCVLEHSSKDLGKTIEQLEVTFDGFEESDAHHYHFAMFARRKLGRWSELKHYPDSSQTESTLPRYRSMLDSWRTMGKPSKLSEEEITRLSVR